MEVTQEHVDALKKNEKPFGLMSEELQEAAIIIKDELGGQFVMLAIISPGNRIDWRGKDDFTDFFRLLAYRLKPGFELPKEEPKYNEHDIYCDGIYYRVKGVQLMDGQTDIYLSECIDTATFAGVQFEGQENDDWYLNLRAFVDPYGDTTSIAVPIRARFINPKYKGDK